ncbi:hypothetical protein PVAG01_03879 [Phlyctema vagabunda]|uniref:Uncharacterized protein n=1 Tax=Phlyctema vagabunda TaxID=108571 RepID=A0ABR4PMZ3_9HELO
MSPPSYLKPTDPWYNFYDLSLYTDEVRPSSEASADPAYPPQDRRPLYLPPPPPLVSMPGLPMRRTSAYPSNFTALPPPRTRHESLPPIATVTADAATTSSVPYGMPTAFPPGIGPSALHPRLHNPQPQLQSQTQTQRQRQGRAQAPFPHRRRTVARVDPHREPTTASCIGNMDRTYLADETTGTTGSAPKTTTTTTREAITRAKTNGNGKTAKQPVDPQRAATTASCIGDMDRTYLPG